jgi:hypothetical protein
LFGINETPNENSDIDSDYYDDDGKNDKEAGPLQINIPFFEEENDKKVEFVVEEKVVFTMRNLNPKDVLVTTEKSEILLTTTLIPTETTEIFSTTVEPETTQLTTTEEVTDKVETTTDLPLEVTTPADLQELATTTLLPTEEPKTTTFISSTSQPSSTTKIFSVDFLPKPYRKSNKNANLQSKISPERSKDRPRKQKTTSNSTKQFKLNKDSSQISKSNRTRVSSKQRKLTTTTTVSPETQKPFFWLPENWKLDTTKEKPILVRFWKNQPLTKEQDQRKNSRMRVFQEETLKN